MKNLLRNLLFCFLTLCIALGGVFGSRLLSRLLLGHTDPAIRQSMPQSPQNAFFLGEGSDIVIYPWDQYTPSECVSLNEFTSSWEGPLSRLDMPSLGAAMANTLGEVFPEEVDTAALGEKIQYSDSNSMFYLPELETEHGTVKMAVGARYITYFHIDLDGDYSGQPASKPNVSARQALEEFRRWYAVGEDPAAESEASSVESVIGESGEAVSYPTYIGLYEFITFYCGLEGSIRNRYPLSNFFPNEQLYGVVCAALMDGTVSTLSQNGETLLSLSVPRDYYGGNFEGGLSLLLFYDEDNNCFTGVSLKVMDSIYNS